MNNTNGDIEAGKKIPEFLDGYADFAEYIASDSELSLYRRFGSLGARNILYLQAELQVLENQLRAFDELDRKRRDSTSNKDEKRSIDAAARAWECFQQQSKAGNEASCQRMKLVLQIRQHMKEYEKAVLRRSQILALEAPTPSTLTVFTNWFRYKKPLRGVGWHLLDDESDLAALKVEEEPDKLTAFIQRYFGYYARDRQFSRPASWGQIYYHPSGRIAWIVSILSVLISVFLLLGAIFALYYVTSMPARLMVLSCFTILFAVSIGLLTDARRPEVFGATAAYAAVLVVFLSAPIS